MERSMILSGGRRPVGSSCRILFYFYWLFQVFVELDELYHGEKYDFEWREKARWIKFEEDVEEGADRWGKPHVASLSFHSLIELRKGLESGRYMCIFKTEISHPYITERLLMGHKKSNQTTKNKKLDIFWLARKFVRSSMRKT